MYLNYLELLILLWATEKWQINLGSQSITLLVNIQENQFLKGKKNAILPRPKFSIKRWIRGLSQLKWRFIRVMGNIHIQKCDAFVKVFPHQGFKDFFCNKLWTLLHAKLTFVRWSLKRSCQEYMYLLLCTLMKWTFSVRLGP